MDYGKVQLKEEGQVGSTRITLKLKLSGAFYSVRRLLVIPETGCQGIFPTDPVLFRMLPIGPCWF